MTGIRRFMLCVFAASAVLASTVVQPAFAETTSATKLLLRWAPAYAGRMSFTQTDAVNVAKAFDVVVGFTNQFKDYDVAMKAANPSLYLLGYLNGSFTPNATDFSDSWYAHDSLGRKITATLTGQYLMDISNASWVSNVANTCASVITSTGYDGCFVDMLGVAPLIGTYLSAMPINPGTGKTWTQSDWLAKTTAISAAVEAASPGKAIVGNGLGSGQRYFDGVAPTEQLLNAMNGGGAELWLRNPTQGVTKFKTEAQWKLDVDMLADAGARSPVSAVLTGTKLWVSATQAQKDQWHKYSLASFLLGTTGSSYYSFFGDSNSGTPTADNAWDHVDVGTATGAYAKTGGVYQRTFSKGLALVNPTTATVTVSLGATYKNLNGVSMSSITMLPNTGEVFTL